MDIREAIRERHSVRQYKPDPIPEDAKEALNALIEECNRESGLHIQLIIDDPECFDTILGRYGKFSGVNNYIAIAGSKKHPNLDETGGYYGDGVILDGLFFPY